jgi:ferredoxin
MIEKEPTMPKVEVEGYGSFEVPVGTRLVNALEANGVDILHRCGGFARCTTCRAAFRAGEPGRMTQAEYNKLDLQDLLGEARLACQIAVEGDMALRPLLTLRESGLSDAGPTPKETITPEPKWVDPATLRATT